MAKARSFSLSVRRVVPGSPATPNLAVVTALTIVPPAHVVVGRTTAFSALDQLGRLVAGVTWGSSVPAKATIDASGNALGVAAGATSITASIVVAGITINAAAYALTVEAQTVTSIVLGGGAGAIVATHASAAFTAVAKDQLGFTMTAQPSFAFASSAPSVAAIDSDTGVATGVAAGSTNITASSGAVTSPALELDVMAQVATDLVPSPSELSVAVGANSGAITAVVLDQLGSPITGASLAFASDTPGDATVGASSGIVHGVAAGGAIVTVSSTVGGGTATGSVAVIVSAVEEGGLVASPGSFSGVPGDTQQESFALGGTTVTDDVIAYSSDPSVVTITSAPEQPTVDDATNETSSTLDVPVTSYVGGGAPETVAVEVDEAGDGTWIRQTEVAWTGNVTDTQTVTATGLTASADYTGKIRAVTLTSAGESYPSDAIPSGTTTAAPAMGTLPVTRGLVERVHAAVGVTLNGSNVAQIVDQVSGAKYAQATPGNQPPLTVNAYGTKPCIALSDGKWLVTVDGSGTPVNVPAINPTGGVGTVIIIGQLRSAAGANSFIVSSHNSTSPCTGYAFAGNDTNGRRAWYYGDSGTLPARIEEGSAADLLLHMHTMVTDTTNPTKQEIYRDGTSVGSSGSVTVANTTKPSYLNTNANNVGAAGTGCSYNFCEKLVFNVTLTSTERDAIRAYAQSEWGTP